MNRGGRQESRLRRQPTGVRPTRLVALTNGPIHRGGGSESRGDRRLRRRWLPHPRGREQVSSVWRQLRTATHGRAGSALSVARDPRRNQRTRVVVSEPLIEGVQIRRYSPHIAAETTVIGSEATGCIAASRRLADYFSSSNQHPGRIAMAAPMAIQIDHRLRPHIAMSALAFPTVAGEQSWTIRLHALGIADRQPPSTRRPEGAPDCAAGRIGCRAAVTGTPTGCDRTRRARCIRAGACRECDSLIVRGVPVVRRSCMQVVSGPVLVAAPAARVAVELVGIHRTSVYVDQTEGG
jgi:SOUL heme-binding protein